MRGHVNPHTRGTRKVRAPSSGLDMRHFPSCTLAAGSVVYRVHRAGFGPWWFSSDGSQRFDIPEPYGTCYVAEHPIGAFLETLARLSLVSTADVAGRRLATIRLSSDLQLADCLDPTAAGFGVTATTSAGYPYRKVVLGTEISTSERALSCTITSVSSTFKTGRYRGKDLSNDQPCIFCGEPADSREDIIPSWLPRQSLVPPGTTRPVTYTSHGVEVKQWSSQTLAFLKIKAVCRKCNTVWMSQVEKAAKRHLLLMMQGNTVQLDQAAQFELATWACLKVMVWESVGEDVVTSSADRELMWKHQQPPLYALVVLGQVPPSDQSEFSLQQVFIRARRRPGAPLDNVSATAITMGDFVAWVILNPTKPRGVDFKPTPIDDDLITIFPPAYGPLQWPPRTALTGEELRSVWRRYLRIGEEVKVEPTN